MENRPRVSSCSAARRNDSLTGAYPAISVQSYIPGDLGGVALYLREIHAECIHVQPVEETRKALAEPRQTVVHDLHIPHIRLQRRHCI